MYVTSEPDDADRLYVVEQDGRIWLSEDGGTPSTFLDIADEHVISPEDGAARNEQGLLSMAFAPDYSTSGLVYVYYTGADDPETPLVDEDGDLYIAELDANEGGPIEDTHREVLEIQHPAARNHNGGQLQLGPDGYLYAATGDGGGGNDPGNNAQDLRSLLGKVLRIDPSGEGEGDYTVPGDNPFAAPAGCGAPPDGCDEIWSYGLRNPWRFSFDRLTGALAIGDVGQAAWEEIDYRPPPDAGRRINFGWDCREGLHEAASASAEHCVQSPVVPFTDPVFEYEQVGGNCSITGGYVVRDPGLGDLLGRYLYADLCAGEVRSLCPAVPLAGGDRSEGIDVQTPTSFGEDAAGRVYVAERGGTVSRFTAPAAAAACPQPPPPPGPPDPVVPPDTTAPALELDAKRRRDVGGSRRLKVLATVDEAAEVELRPRPRGDRRPDRAQGQDEGARGRCGGAGQVAVEPPRDPAHAPRASKRGGRRGALQGRRHRPGRQRERASVARNRAHALAVAGGRRYPSSVVSAIRSCSERWAAG